MRCCRSGRRCGAVRRPSAAGSRPRPSASGRCRSRSPSAHPGAAAAPSPPPRPLRCRGSSRSTRDRRAPPRRSAGRTWPAAWPPDRDRPRSDDRCARAPGRRSPRGKRGAGPPGARCRAWRRSLPGCCRRRNTASRPSPPRRAASCRPRVSWPCRTLPPRACLRRATGRRQSFPAGRSARQLVGKMQTTSKRRSRATRQVEIAPAAAPVVRRAEDCGLQPTNHRLYTDNHPDSIESSRHVEARDIGADHRAQPDRGRPPP